ncbi:hypothetical protein [Catellatospora sichuanensis]|uniref:hypothetical protein n=1 Tax=Catellatospora sichuanensis TaxID=1969805 RepID=UPI0011833D1B|nr:hypothetical protein [Catellatospora sichuanensis]
MNVFSGVDVADGQPVSADLIPAAVTAGPFVYQDGATQVFDASGATTYVEGGVETHGEWSVDDGRFCSFWPPNYRACYDLHWMVEAGAIVGLRFTSLRDGTGFDGRYR